MKLQKQQIFSAVDNLTLNLVIAEPDEGNVKGVIQIAHGMCEYVMRYRQMMEHFTAKGYVVAGIDHRGHGESVWAKDDLGFFYEDTGTAVVRDAVEVTKLLKEKYSAVPITLFGHSMGSLVSLVYLQRNDKMVDKVILSGTPCKNPASGIAILLTNLISLFKGERYRSPLLYSLSIGAYDKRFEGEGRAAWLSENKTNVEKYKEDPFCAYVFTCNGFKNLFTLLNNTYKRRFKVKNPDLPILFLAGTDDPVIGSEKTWRASQEHLRKMGYQNVDGKLYPNARHEFLNEKNPLAYYDDILKAIEGK